MLKMEVENLLTSFSYLIKANRVFCYKVKKNQINTQ